jgi:peptidylprolyl isomerase
MIKKGSIVDVHYVGKLSDGAVFDSSEGKNPLKFKIGSGQIIPGFEQSLIGKKVGDKITVKIQPEFAYGSFKEELIIEVPIDKMPGGVKVGELLNAIEPNGNSITVIVKEVNSDYVKIDFNHPLAGKELTFDIEVIEVEESNEN